MKTPLAAVLAAAGVALIAVSTGCSQPINAHTIAMNKVYAHGWARSENGCLDILWNRESGWNVFASNPSSGAYGIPQALPGSKMAASGPNWRTDASTQIDWGLNYIAGTYGSPCGALSHSYATGWY